MKKGQITVFIAIGLIVVLITGVILFKVTQLNKEEMVEEHTGDSTKLLPVKNYVETCMQQVGTDAMTLLGEQGRIYPKAFIQSPTSSVSYFYYKGNGFFPERVQFIEEDVSRYMKEHLSECLNDFAGLDYDISTREDKLKVETSFNEHDAVLSVKFPLTVDFGGSKTTLSDFNTQIDIDFLAMYDFTKEIYDKTRAEPDWVDVDFITSQPYDVKLVKIDRNTMVYEITDKDGLNNRPYTYRFAMKYNL